ncbi:MAG: WD40 repeat domain-containing protein, partial [Pirellulaceae bacterium]
MGPGRQTGTLLDGPWWPVIEAAWSPDGEEIAAGIRGHSVVVWDAATGKKLLRLRGQIDVIKSVDWSPDGKRLATGGRGGIVKIWDARQQQDSVSLGQDAKQGVSWSPDDRLLAWISNHETIKICDANTGTQVHTLHQPEWSEINAISWSPNGKHLASSSDDAAIVVWDTVTGNELLSWTHEGVRAPVALDSLRSVNIAWHPDGHRLASVSEKEKTVRIWDASTGKQVSSFEADLEHGHPYQEYVVWSPDGERLATLSRWNVVEIRETVGWRKLHGIRVGRAECIAWSPDARYLCAGGVSRARVWDTSTGREILSLEGPTVPIWSVTWSRDGRRIASTSLNETRLWDATTGQQLFILNGGCPAWSHDNKRIATVADDGTVKVYDASIGYDNARYLHDLMHRDTPAPDKPITDVSKAIDYVLDSAQRLAASDRVDEASALLQKLTTRFPDVPVYRQELASVYFARGDGPFHQGDYRKAFPDLEQAIRVNPEYSEAYDHRGQIYLAQGKLDKAIADFDQAVKFGPWQGAYTYADRGGAYLLKGAFDDGFADFSKAIELAPESGVYQYMRALARLVGGDVDVYRGDCADTLKHFGQAEDVNAGHWVAWTCALAPDAVADYSAAVALAKKPVESDPKSIFYLNTLGAILYRAGRLEEALDRLAEADGLMAAPDPSLSSSPAY